MKDYFLDKLDQSPFFRIKAKVVERYGQFWFEKISDSEWKNYRKNLVTQVFAKNQKELMDFVQKEQKVVMDSNQLMYKFFMIESFDLNGKEVSVLMFKFHHCFCDGQGCSILFQSLSENCSVQNLRLPEKQNTVLSLLYLPIALFRVFFYQSTFRKDCNLISRGQKCKFDIRGAFTTEMDIDEIKKVCKQRKCTINDYCFSLISVALYRYMEKDPPDSV